MIALFVKVTPEGHEGTPDRRAGSNIHFIHTDGVSTVCPGTVLCSVRGKYRQANRC